MSLPRQLPWLDTARIAAQELLRRDVHAILLHGAHGIGKKSLGFELAQAMLCENAQGATQACGTCTGCVLMEAGSHPDFRFVLPDALKTLRPGAALDANDDGESDGVVLEPDKPARASRELRIEQVRALADFANIATHRGGRRVVLLAPAESLNGPAANALLKLLEEPPPGTFFVLCTDAIDELPPTIRSRCVLVRVEMPARDTATQWLASQGCAAAAAEALLAAGGAPLAALEALTAPETEQRHHELLFEILQSPEKGDAADIARRIPKDLAVGPALTLMQRWCWDLIALRMTGNVRYHPSSKVVAARIAARLSEARLWDWSKSINLRQTSREHPLNSRLVIESLLLQYLNCLTPMDREPGR